MVIVNIKPQLRNWIEHNLDRGCPPEQLIEGMISQRFDPPIAQGLVRVFVEARNAGTPLTFDNIRVDIPTAAYSNDPSRMAAGNSILISDRRVSVVPRLSRPVIALLANVLSSDECEQLIALARPRLKPSTVVDPVTGEHSLTEYRNSEGMFFALCETPLIAVLDIRFSQIMNLPIDHGEGLQVLRYGSGTLNPSHSPPTLTSSFHAMRLVSSRSVAADSGSALS